MTQDCALPFTVFIWTFIGMLWLVLIPLRMRLSCATYSSVAMLQIYETLIQIFYMGFCMVWIIVLLIIFSRVSASNPAGVQECSDNGEFYKANFWIMALIAAWAALIPFFTIIIFILTLPCKLA